MNPMRILRSPQRQLHCQAYTDRGRCRNQSARGKRFCHAHVRSYTFDEWYDPVANTRARNELKQWQKRRYYWGKKHQDKPFPERLPASYDRLVCGAKTKRGTPCRRRDLYNAGRCPLHGGLSTGPRTAEGKRRSAQNGF